MLDRVDSELLKIISRYYVVFKTRIYVIVNAD